MSLKSISLKKLLQLCGAEEQRLVSEIRNDIRLDIRRQQGKTSGGGDFHPPFWRDAKNFVFEGVDLYDATEQRIAKDKNKKRLYPDLRDGFLSWWDKERMTTNEKIGILENSIHNHYPVPHFDLVLKVDNLLCLQVGNDISKVIYPYFPEIPSLTPKWARVGLWLMEQALSEFSITEMKILDVIRGKDYSQNSHPLTGKEQQIFDDRYSIILELWNSLKKEYPDFQE
ncbi:hypothetical protein [Sphingorhabdus sp. YGSMI21]|uniref:hypothetical protein n=1 Tax=Sphingorhabdus sp. YGSMI21 TaxID=2077182 RepID=UPI000F4FEF6B|nr:hypothetical protein [Sphingorhabdus sp. YGSMI21]